MTTVEQAEQIILAEVKNFGTELIPFERSLKHILAEDIYADRDLPPYNRITMDGIAISYAAYASGIKTFSIKATQAAGDKPINIITPNECIEIMTGAALPPSTDTVIPYEDILIENGSATITIAGIKQGQNIHYKGKDKKQGELIVSAGTMITPAVINVTATVGKTELLVQKTPRVVVLSTGDELVEVSEIPSPYQVRRSNVYSIQTVLQQCGVHAHMLHLPDDQAIIERELTQCLTNYDVLILSGGISMGKYDYLPASLEKLGVQKLFHKVRQRPGKPFWFGQYKDKVVVFAFPGNPVSTFMCLHRYMLPWLRISMGLPAEDPIYAILAEDITFTPALTYLMQVKLTVNQQAQIIATPIQGNGSGDLANLTDTDAFMELPAERSNFMKGEIFRVWKF